MGDIEMREAQLVYVELETRWSDERQRTPELMRELEKAENRLIKLFMDGWAPRLVMAFAWSHYRRILLRWCGGKRKTDNRCRNVPRLSEEF